ncbi:MAG TPA: 4-(cytidine 5'-diphospho)-2-C-methyl-D-erythritol kinase [Gemmatimonadaceae bacterium]|nr:4-(cytidine 5'-diphospho)-2-C-methyl-D-erythritol kinase [Gemmatimonadaceae bacterium]
MSAAGRTLAQAKVNLALRILGRNTDGYHSIETVFLRLELADLVTVKVAERERSLRCDAMRGEPSGDNLAYRAAARFAEDTGWPGGFHIDVEKRIPIGGGLGGGSADAAAVLRILNALSPRPVAIDRLLGIAASLGADVPFLTTDHVMALGWDRGERLEPLPVLPQRSLALIVPARGMSTKEAYGMVSASRGQYEPRPRTIRPEMFASWDLAARHSVNEFEPFVEDALPEMRSWLEIGARLGLLTRLSGSGSTVYVVDAGTKDSLQAAIASLGLDSRTKVIRTRSAASVVPVEILG